MEIRWADAKWINAEKGRVKCIGRMLGFMRGKCCSAYSQNAFGNKFN
jgi:hypothetical protein